MKKQALEWKWNECHFKKLLNFLKSIENSVKSMNIDVRVKTFFLILVKTKSWSIDTNKEKLYVREVSSFSFSQPFLLGEDLTAAVRQMSRLFPLSSRADSKERLLSSLVHFGLPGSRNSWSEEAEWKPLTWVLLGMRFYSFSFPFEKRKIINLSKANLFVNRYCLGLNISYHFLQINKFLFFFKRFSCSS